METSIPEDNPEQNRSLSRYNLLHKRYADVFDFLILSIANMTNMAICTITLFDENDVFVVASNDDSIKKIWPLSRALQVASETGEANKNLFTHSIEKFEIKFYASFPIMDSNGSVMGSLNIFDNKKRVLTIAEKEILEKAIQQINRWIASKAKEQRLKKHDILFQLSNDLIGITTFEGEFIKLNSAFSMTMGWSDIEFQHSPFINFMHPDDYEKTVKVMRQLRAGKSINNFTNRYITKYNNIKYIE